MEDHTYQVWLRGDCVCCQGSLDSYQGDDGEVKPLGIGEGVFICGRCSAMQHLDAVQVPGLREVILEAITSRDDSALNAHIGLYRWSDGSLCSWPEGSKDE